MSEHEFNLAVFSGVIMWFAVNYFGLTEVEAENRLDHWWQTKELEEIMGYHPFFAAGLLGNCEQDKIREKYLVHHREIDRVWLAP